MFWKRFRPENVHLAIAVLAAVLIFLGLYVYSEGKKIEEPPEQSEALENWNEDISAANGLPLRENKDIYKEGVDSNIYDVYISAFPTKGEDGNTLTLSDFALHTARDHDYNPVLSCNIQIFPEGEKPGTLLTTETANATIRVRGNSSRGDTFKSYKVKFLDENMMFRGQSSLNLNKHSEDDIKIVTKLCTDLLRDEPDMVTYNTNFMRLWIRDASLPLKDQKYEYQGLYTNTEQPNKAFLRRRGLSSECVMYKARNFSFQFHENLRDTDDPLYDERLFEQVMGIREGKGHKKLLEMVGAVSNLSLDSETVFDTYFNEENYITWLAFSILTGADDILNHNFILYSPNNSNTWYFIPWDFDSNLQEHTGYIMTPSLAGGQKLNMVPLHRRFFRMDGSLKKLDQRMRELMETTLSEENINGLLDRYMPVLEKTMMKMPDITLSKYSPAELPDAVRRVPDTIWKNYMNFINAFQYPSPMFVDMPEIREDGRITFSWEPSYSYQNLDLTYSVRLYSDFMKKDLLYETTGIRGESLDTDLKLADGTYYLDVRVTDSDGKEQLSLEHFELSGATFIYQDGLMEFTIRRNEIMP